MTKHLNSRGRRKDGSRFGWVGRLSCIGILPLAILFGLLLFLPEEARIVLSAFSPAYGIPADPDELARGGATAYNTLWHLGGSNSVLSGLHLSSGAFQLVCVLFILQSLFIFLAAVKLQHKMRVQVQAQPIDPVVASETETKDNLWP